jgi:hypothetical protein
MFMDFLGYGNHVELYSEEISRGGEGLGVSCSSSSTTTRRADAAVRTPRKRSHTSLLSRRRSTWTGHWEGEEALFERIWRSKILYSYASGRSGFETAARQLHRQQPPIDNHVPGGGRRTGDRLLYEHRSCISQFAPCRLSPNPLLSYLVVRPIHFLHTAPTPR